jgi:hypothetical protein
MGGLRAALKFMQNIHGKRGRKGDFYSQNY